MRLYFDIFVLSLLLFSVDFLHAGTRTFPESVEDVRVRDHGGVPHVFLNGKPIQTRWFWGWGNKDNAVYEEELKLATEAGIDFFSFMVHVPWTEPGTDDTEAWNEVFRKCDQILKINPNAKLVPRLRGYPPYNPPPWWSKKHPGEMVRYSPAEGSACFEVASEKWRQDAAEVTHRFVERLEEKYGKSIAGYHPTGQGTGEWYYAGAMEKNYHGYSDVAADAFREWLRTRYQTDEALAAAWHKPGLIIDGVSVPTPGERIEAGKHGDFLDPKSYQAIIDHNVFQQDAMADSLLLMAKTIREATKGKKLVVMFYGYTFEFGFLERGAPASGHYALRRVLDSPDIDILCSPFTYTDRDIGGSAPMQSVTESAPLHGKLWLVEDDTRTHTLKKTGMGQKTENLWETQQVLIRNLGQMTIRNFGTWWMDLSDDGLFSDPKVWDVMRNFEKIENKLLEKPDPFRPEIAVLMHEPSILHAAHNSNRVTWPLFRQCQQAMARCGSSFGLYLLDDLLDAKIQPEVLMLMTPWALSPEEIEALKKNSRAKVRFWFHAPGLIVPGKGIEMENMTLLTGFRFAPYHAKNKPLIVKATPIGLKAGLERETMVQDVPLTAFSVVDANPKEVLGVWEDGTAAVVCRRADDGGYDIFCGIPRLRPALARFAAKLGKVHVVTEDDVVSYSNDSLILLHGTQDGSVTITAKNKTVFHDVLSGERLGTGKTLTLNLKKGESRFIMVQ